MKYDAVALGELLIDFTPAGTSPAGNPYFERNAGGAPVNVLAALSRLGKHTAFVGKVGDDPFGQYLREALVAENIADSGLVQTRTAHTTMAFVHLDGDGERSFHFCRHPGADAELTFDEVNRELLSSTRIFHFGSISMTTEPAYSATVQAVRLAKSHGALITYDPNWRPALWMDDAHSRAAMEEGLHLADIVKVSEEELVFLTGSQDLADGAGQLLNSYPIALLLVTRGAKGTYYANRTVSGNVGSYPVTPVDTTAAGDGFMGAFIYRLLELDKPVTEWERNELERAVAFANAAGAIATTRKGAIASLAKLDEIAALQHRGGGNADSI
ncbi:MULTISPECIES: carbohydrate kinase family protein [Paenibacillus]|uniref:Carbohydrate kinase n=1 Tax=Paenibacillus woosongensis TaxID=307580 RepID=A0A7X2Z516_9BACL|nr:carbohydrate kinase [Paenibacillus woosongensis]MUG46991.1 carbohydrate kinase [Paenibacillus woosongensis]